MIEMLSKATLFWDIYVYGDDEEGENLIVSYECYDLCMAIADEFQYNHKWLDILHNKQFKLENVFDVDVIASLLLYLVASITFEDKFIDALNNIKALRLFKSVSIYRKG